MQKKIYTVAVGALFVALVCCNAVGAWAETVVDVVRAGTLSSVLKETDPQLKITGKINGTDAKYLRSLVVDGKVTSLDLSGVRIVSGGTAYYESYKTENDVLGERMFYECSKLRAIVLPTTITAIGSCAFSNSGLKKVDIPNSVSRLGGDAFAYCGSLDTVIIGSRVSKLDQGVFYSSSVRRAFVKPLTPPSTPSYLFSSNPTIRVYSEVLNDYKQSGWKSYGNIVGKLEDYFPMEGDSTAIVNELRSTWFEDAACTELKAEYRGMSDDELKAAMAEGGMPVFMADIAVKLKNDNWASYEKDFRIQSYKAFSDANYWNDKMGSSGGSFMGNPTGIYAKDLEPLYVFVDEDVSDDATLYIAGCVGNDLVTNAKAGTRLKKGLNIIDGTKNALYYIIYTADTRAMTKTLAEWPDIKIHIEGGTVNGYYDVARHSDKDYRALLTRSTHELFTIKGGEALFNFKKTTYKTVWPTTIDRSICWFDSLTVWQKELMGFCVSVFSGQRAAAPWCLTGGEAIFPIYYNNPNFAIEGKESDAGYANSTSYRTSYNSVDCIRNSFDVSRWEMDDWCAGHECGHNNQHFINLEGGTEVSNNLFANVVRYLDGLVTSTGSPLSTVMDEYARRVPYFIRDVDSQLRMYYQLYLYYHQAQKNTSFYPTLFAEFRKDPMTVWGNSYNSSLKFVRKVCEVAQEDLTDFFTAWGFFEPFTNLSIEDYGAHTMTVRQRDIDRTLEEISKYPKKNRTILFVEDRADYVLTTDFLTTAGKHRRGSEKVGQCGDLGQFTSFLPGGCTPAEYVYYQADSLYAMEGTGGVGFLALDSEGTMLTAANALTFCIPTSVGDAFTLFAVDADGTMHETSYAGSGFDEVHLETAGTLADSLAAKVIKATISGPVNGTDFKYMRQLNAKSHLVAINLTDASIVSGGDSYDGSHRTSANAIGEELFRGCLKLVAIRLPEKITKIASNAFSDSGLKEIVIPDAVTSVGGDAFAYCKQLNTVTVGAKVKSMSQGVFYSSAVKHAYVKPLTPPSISSYLFSSNPVIHVYASALSAYKASGWAEYGTLVGDLDDYLDIDVIPADEETAAETDAPVYDLMGRRVSDLQPSTLYIQGGKKFIVK